MTTSQPGFWDDVENSQKVMKELNNLKSIVETVASLEESYDDIVTLIEMGYEEEDESIVEDIKSEYDSFVEQYESLRMETLLSGEYDRYGAILSLHAGAGGTESCDWVSMLT